MRFILILLLLAELSASAQKNWKPGSYTDKNGQINSGYINYKEWFRNPNSIEFSSNENGKDLLTLSKNDMRAFMVADDSYEIHYCKVSMDESQISHVAKGVDTSFKMELIILKVLIKGKINHYQYTDEIKTRYYIHKDSDGSEPEELVYHIYEPLDKESNLIEEKTYIIQLIAAGLPYTRESKLTRKLDAARYDDDDLIPIINLINNEGKQVKSQKVKGYLQPNIGAGLSVSSFKLVGDRGGPYATSEYKFQGSSSPLFFAGVDMFLGPKTAKMFIRTNASWCSFSEKGHANKSTLEFNYTYDMSFKYSLTSLSASIAYNLIKTKKLNGYIGAGPNFHLIKVSSFKEHAVRQSPVDPNIRYEYDLAPFIFQETSIQLILMGGVTINQMIDLGIQYRFGSANLIQLLAVKNQSGYFDFTVAYKFPRKK